MNLNNAVEESCERLYAACESIEQAVKLIRECSEKIDNELDEDTDNTVSKTRKQHLNRLYDEVIGNEIAADKLQGMAVDLLKRQNKLLQHIERESESIRELEL